MLNENMEMSVHAIFYFQPRHQTPTDANVDYDRICGPPVFAILARLLVRDEKIHEFVY